MRGEMYVTWLVQRSPLARGIANELRGPGYDDILDELRDPDRINTAGPAFAKISARLQSALDFNVLRPLVEDDLIHLAHPKIWGALAPILRCPEADVLVSLLDQVTMERDLDEAGHQRPQAAAAEDSQTLFFSMLHGGNGIKAISRHYYVGANNWGDFMDTRHWILPGATAKLRGEAKRQGWAKGSTPVRPTEVLAAIIDETLKPPTWRVGPMEEQFDALAVVAIRRRVAHLIEELRKEAIEQAELATQLLPAEPSP